MVIDEMLHFSFNVAVNIRIATQIYMLGPMQRAQGKSRELQLSMDTWQWIGILAIRENVCVISFHTGSGFHIIYAWPLVKL